MEPEIVIEFNPAAFRHGIDEIDIRIAVEQFIYNEVMSDDESKHLLLGFDSNANFLEIIYNAIDSQTINVFHAMKCRRAYIPLADRKE
jgi:hypothetical protein